MVLCSEVRKPNNHKEEEKLCYIAQNAILTDQNIQSTVKTVVFVSKVLTTTVFSLENA